MAHARATRGGTACRAWRQSATHPSSNRCTASLRSRGLNATAQRGLSTRTAPLSPSLGNHAFFFLSHFFLFFSSFPHPIPIIIQLPSPPPLLPSFLSFVFLLLFLLSLPLYYSSSPSSISLFFLLSLPLLLFNINRRFPPLSPRSPPSLDVSLLLVSRVVPPPSSPPI